MDQVVDAPVSRAHARAEAGQGTPSYVGVIIVMVALVGALILQSTSWGERLGAAVEAAICRVTGGECEIAPGELDAAGDSPRDLMPQQCAIGSNTQGASFSMTVAVVTIGNGYDLTLGEGQKRLPDGSVVPTYTVSVDETGSVGAETGVGGELRFGKSDFGATLDVGATASGKNTREWEFDSAAERDAFIELFNQHEARRIAEREAAMNGTPIFFPLPELDPLPPTSATASSGKLEFNGEASAGAFLWDEDPKPGKDPDNISLNLGASASGAVSQEVAVKTQADGTRSTIMTVSGSGDVGVDGVVTGSDILSGSATHAVQIDERPGPDGQMQIVGVTFVRETEGGVNSTPEFTTGPFVGQGSASVNGGSAAPANKTTVTTSLPVDDSNRDVVEQWLADSAQVSSQAGTPVLLIPENVYAPTENVDSPMGAQLYANGTTQIDEWETTDDGFGAAISAKLGVSAGLGFNLTDTSATVVSSQGLANPDPSTKVRPLRDNEACG